MNIFRNHARNRAFTLVELLAVVAIIMALLGIFIVAIRSSLQKGRIANVIGTANSVATASTDFLQKAGSTGVLPLTEGEVLVVTANASAGVYAILDTVLLSEGALEKPLSIRMGQSQSSTMAAMEWNITQQKFTGIDGADFSTMNRIECGLSPGTVVAQGTEAAPVSIGGVPTFKVDGVHVLPKSTRVVYLVIPNVTVSDAYALGLAANGAQLMSANGVVDEVTAAYGNAIGPCMWNGVDDTTGTTTVFFYVTRQ